MADREPSAASASVTPLLGSRFGAVIAALSLRSSSVWRDVSSTTLADLAGYVQLVFGSSTIVLPWGHFNGGEFGACSASDGELFLCDRKRACVAVYRDGVLQRRIDEENLWQVTGIAVVGGSMYVAGDNCSPVAVRYPRAGGRPLFYGAYCPGADTQTITAGIGARADGRVYASHSNRSQVWREDTVCDCAKVSCPLGLALANDKIFVVSYHELDGCVSVFRISDTLKLEHHVGGGVLKGPKNICFYAGLLFVTEPTRGRIVVLDADSGDEVATCASFDRDQPWGVTATDEGTLFVTVASADKKTWRLLAVQLL